MVSRCICSNITFREIKEIAHKKNYTTVSELREADICARRCRYCVPYIEKVLETGEVSFEPIDPYKSWGLH